MFRKKNKVGEWNREGRILTAAVEGRSAKALQGLWRLNKRLKETGSELFGFAELHSDQVASLKSLFFLTSVLSLTRFSLPEILFP